MLFLHGIFRKKKSEGPFHERLWTINTKSKFRVQFLYIIFLYNSQKTAAYLPISRRGHAFIYPSVIKLLKSWKKDFWASKTEYFWADRNAVLKTDKWKSVAWMFIRLQLHKLQYTRLLRLKKIRIMLIVYCLHQVIKFQIFL